MKNHDRFGYTRVSAESGGMIRQKRSKTLCKNEATTERREIMFIDKATIKVQAGSGGNGAVSFHREKFVAAGGPDGGDGGRGGNIVLQGCESINTLIDFKYKRKFIAQNGQNGG